MFKLSSFSKQFNASARRFHNPSYSTSFVLSFADVTSAIGLSVEVIALRDFRCNALTKGNDT